MEQKIQKRKEIIFNDKGFANVNFGSECAAQLFKDEDGKIYVTAAMNRGGYPIDIKKIICYEN